MDKGGRIRTYQMLRELKRSHHITYLTLDDGTAAPDAPRLAAEYCHELVRVPFRRSPNYSPRFFLELAGSVASSLPYTILRYRSSAFRDALERLLEQESFDVLVCDFLTPAINVPDGVSCSTVLFEHNVEAQIWKRHFEVASSPFRKALLFLEWRKLRRFEASACRRFDRVITVSAQDRDTILAEYGVRANAVPTGVDTRYFSPGGNVQRRPRHLVFTGSMDWLPNIDGMQFFVGQVLPRVRTVLDDVTLTIVGRDPAPEVLDLASSVDGVTVTGRVDDVRPAMEEAAAFIVPLRVGGGTRLKIFEALAMECPVVSTSIGAEGLPLTDGTEILIADDPADFARAVLRVLTDPDLAASLGRRGAEAVRTRFGWDRAAEEFARLCGSERQAVAREH